MKRGAVLAVALLGACSGGGDSKTGQAGTGGVATASATVSAGAGPVAVASAPAMPIPVAARTVKDENDLYEFEYSYPATAGAIARLKASLDGDLNTQLGKLKHDAEEARDDARAAGFPFRKYSYSQTWQVVTDLPGWLSLSASFSNYTGGAHGMYWHGTMLWDRQAARARDPLALFASKQAFRRAIREPFCDELDRQRAKKRGAPVNRASGDEFDKCIDPAAETIILGSHSHKVFDRIGILVAPYDAGPYVEGEYEVTVPVTSAVIAAVRPEFRSSFAVVR